MSEDDPASSGVGYGRPPVQHRFAPGRSGNPRGRPKRPQDLASLLATAMDAKIIVNQNGTRRRVTTRDAVVSKLLLGGLKGSHRDTRDTLRLIAALLLPGVHAANGEGITIVISPEDAAV